MIYTDLTEVQKLLSRQEDGRIHQAAREAQERVAATREGRADAEQRIDVGRVLYETAADKWLLESDRFALARRRADEALQEERASPLEPSRWPAHLVRLLVGLGVGLAVGAAVMRLVR